MELYLSSDGKHTVHISAETPEDKVKLLPQAKLRYDAVVRKYGTKAEMWQGARGGRAAGNGQPAEKVEAEAPVCPVHNRPVAFRQRRHGPFWSYPERMANGAWCTVTKDADEPSNGYASSIAYDRFDGRVSDDGFNRSVPLYDMMDADINKSTMKRSMTKLAVIAALLLLAALALLRWMRDQMVIRGLIDWRW